ncbi:hypothetical protein Btru_027487 [Bulinus truncatus]|nr:hypothetical protein Btru_027487 [Bulinus truncatus]
MKYSGIHSSDGMKYSGIHRSDGTKYSGIHSSDGTKYSGIHSSDGTKYSGIHRSDETKYSGIHSSDGTKYSGIHSSDGMKYSGIHSSDGMKYAEYTAYWTPATLATIVGVAGQQLDLLTSKENNNSHVTLQHTVTGSRVKPLPSVGPSARPGQYLTSNASEIWTPEIDPVELWVQRVLTDKEMLITRAQ